MNKYMKNQKGAISIFTVLAMIFFLVFILGAFSLASRRNQTQVASLTELKALYKKDGNEIYMSMINPSETVIPIYGENDFTSIGTNVIKTINKKNYTFSETSDYILKNDIKINLEKIYDEDIPLKDFTMYSSSYKVSKSSYDVFYMYDSDGDGEKEKYKLIAFSKEGKQSISNTVRGEKTFCILGETELDKYKFNDKYTFLNLQIIDSYIDIFSTEADTLPIDIEKLEAYEKFDGSLKEYYIFVKAESTKQNVTVPVDKLYLADVVQVGDYIDYPVEYNNVGTNMISTEQGSYGNPEFISTLNGWRVIDINKVTKEVKIISAGTPIIGNYRYAGYVKSDYNFNKEEFAEQTIDISKNEAIGFVRKLTTGFSEEFWWNILENYTEWNPEQIQGKEFIDTKYAESISTINKSLLEKTLGRKVNYNEEIVDVESSNRENSLINNGSKYFIADCTEEKITEICEIQENGSTIPYNVYLNIFKVDVIDVTQDAYLKNHTSLTTYPNKDYDRNYSNSYRAGIRPVITLKADLYSVGDFGEHGATVEDAWELKTEEEIENNG